MKTREEIISEWKRIRIEIQQIFNDAEYWNENVRKPHEERIDPDPDGSMAKRLKGIDALLEKEIRIAKC